MARLYAGAMDAADNAEKRLLALLRSQVPSANRAGRGTDTFVQEQNIAHYRALLQALEDEWQQGQADAQGAVGLDDQIRGK